MECSPHVQRATLMMTSLQNFHVWNVTLITTIVQSFHVQRVSHAKLSMCLTTTIPQRNPSKQNRLRASAKRMKKWQLVPMLSFSQSGRLLPNGWKEMYQKSDESKFLTCFISFCYFDEPAVNWKWGTKFLISLERIRMFLLKFWCFKKI